MDILALVESVPRNVATEALYYCLRALKQAGLPSESKKDYFFDTASSSPSTEGVALARSILNDIARTAGEELDRIPRPQINKYIQEVARATSVLSARVEGFSVEKGSALLERMRSS
jgi:hypothetical protein